MCSGCCDREHLANMRSLLQAAATQRSSLAAEMVVSCFVSCSLRSHLLLEHRELEHTNGFSGCHLATWFWAFQTAPGGRNEHGLPAQLNTTE